MSSFLLWYTKMDPELITQSNYLTSRGAGLFSSIQNFADMNSKNICSRVPSLSSDRTLWKVFTFTL